MNSAANAFASVRDRAAEAADAAALRALWHDEARLQRAALAALPGAQSNDPRVPLLVSAVRGDAVDGDRARELHLTQKDVSSTLQVLMQDLLRDVPLSEANCERLRAALDEANWLEASRLSQFVQLRWLPTAVANPVGHCFTASWVASQLSTRRRINLDAARGEIHELLGGPQPALRSFEVLEVFWGADAGQGLGIAPSMLLWHDDSRTLFVATRGTQQFRDLWSGDLGLELHTVPRSDPSPSMWGIEVHTGFWASFAAQREAVAAAVAAAVATKPVQRIVYTGHSLGGAVAELLALDNRVPNIPVRLVTFAAPQIGAETATEAVRTRVRHLRVVHEDDSVPTLISVVPTLFWHGDRARYGGHGAEHHLLLEDGGRVVSIGANHRLEDNALFSFYDALFRFRDYHPMVCYAYAMQPRAQDPQYPWQNANAEFGVSPPVGFFSAL